ncbi:hypothetical protein A4U53_022780 [Rhizobium ruizarguesonis]|uniref:Uncharacterized protein n=2 Tax=Rhizobium TaxID=379 RepID=A0A179BA02_RHILE|nr:hypothetical protein [Rhizobium leguminosarum]OAP88189.1 hypothetical protein A4U53_08765 [Rhizobium leguminosarum]
MGAVSNKGDDAIANKQVRAGVWSHVERWVPPISLILIPLLTVLLSHVLNADKEEFERFRYASEVVANDKASPDLKSWAISEITLFLKTHGSPSANMDLQKAQLYGLIMGDLLRSTKGLYCYNIIPAVNQISDDIGRLVEADAERISALDLVGLDERKAKANKEYITSIMKNTASLRSSLVDGVKGACEGADASIDERASKPFDSIK